MKTKHYITALAVSLAVTVAACGGGGGGLTDEQADLAARVARDAGMKTDVAECLVDKLADEMGEDEAASTLRSDTNLSEQEGSEAAAVAAAFTECNDDSFEQVFGYYPEN